MPPPIFPPLRRRFSPPLSRTPDHVVTLPERLSIAAQRAVVKSMLNAGLLAEASASEAQDAWRTTESDERLLLRATEVGLATVATQDDDGSTQSTAAGSDAEGDVQFAAGMTAPTAPLPPRAAPCCGRGGGDRVGRHHRRSPWAARCLGSSARRPRPFHAIVGRWRSTPLASRRNQAASRAGFATPLRGATVAQVAEATAGPTTQSAASSPASRSRASRSPCWSASARSDPARKAFAAATPSLRGGRGLMRARPTVNRYAVGLYRVSTAEQGQSGLGLEAQQASVRAFAAAQGWALVAEHSDAASGKDDQRVWPASCLLRATARSWVAS